LRMVIYASITVAWFCSSHLRHPSRSLNFKLTISGIGSASYWVDWFIKLAHDGRGGILKLRKTEDATHRSPRNMRA